MSKASIVEFLHNKLKGKKVKLYRFEYSPGLFNYYFTPKNIGKKRAKFEIVEGRIVNFNGEKISDYDGDWMDFDIKIGKSTIHVPVHSIEDPIEFI